MTVDVAGLARAGRWLRGPRSVPEAPAADAEGVVIGHADDGTPVRWPAPTREAAGHVLVAASSGAGKTMLVAHALVSEMLAAETEGGEPAALLIVDPKSDLCEAVTKAICARAPHRLRDLVLLDPFSAEGFPFNLCRYATGDMPAVLHALRISGLVAAVSTGVGQVRHLGQGPRQIELTQRVVHGALGVPGGDVLLAVESFVARNGFRKLAEITTDERAREVLAATYASDELKASCASRTRTVFAASPSLERMLSAPTCIDFAELLAPGRICLVDLGRPIGGLGMLREFYANLLARLAIDHLLARPSPSPAHHVRVVVDEAPVVGAVLADRVEDALTTGRSRNLSLVQITQGTTLMQAVDPTWVHATVGNTPTKLVGRLGAPDAEHLAREQAPGRGVEESLGAIRGRFTGAVTNLADREFFLLRPGGRVRFRAVDIDVAGWARAVQVHREEVEAARRRLALPADLPPRRTLDQLHAERQPQAPRRRRGQPGGNGNGAARQPELPLPPATPRTRWG